MGLQKRSRFTLTYVKWNFVSHGIQSNHIVEGVLTSRNEVSTLDECGVRDCALPMLGQSL